MARRQLKLYGKKATADDVLLEINNLLYAKGHRPAPLRPAEIANEYNKKLLEDRFRIISRIISLANDSKKLIQIGIGFQTDDSRLQINEFDLDNYLSELETLSLYVNDDVISIKYAYELFNNQIMDIFNNNDISNYIEKSRMSDKSNLDLWDNLFKAKNLLTKYKIKKLKSS